MRFPHKMTVELTAKCNFRCPYCYCVWHEFPKLAGPELDTDEWKDVLDRFAAAALSGASFIQLGAMMAEGRGKRHLDLRQRAGARLAGRLCRFRISVPVFLKDGGGVCFRLRRSA